MDKSLFIYGSHIPHEFRADFVQANGGYELPLGESKPITLLLGNTEYEAILRHAVRKDSGGGRLELRYDNSRGFRELLRSRFPVSHRYLQVDVEPDDEAAIDRQPENVPEHLREYLEFHETEIPFRYRVETIPAQAGSASLDITPDSFDRVWSDLQSVVVSRGTVHTLAQGVPNQVRWIESKGIEIATKQGVEILPRSMFEQSWQTLVQMGLIAADHLPGEARFRSTAICALLAQLPYVDYTIHPRTTLFLTSHSFTHGQLVETFKVGVQGGIRHVGSAENPRLVIFITGDPRKPDPDHPYLDRWEGETFYYCGEGLEGDQTMTRGNRALRSNMDSDFPVYGFQKNAKGAYSYLGRFKVFNVLEERQPDSLRQLRQVYIFEMRRVPADSAPVVVAPVEDAKLPEVSKEPTRPLFLRVAAPIEPSIWSECLAEGYLCIAGADQVGDLRGYSSSQDLLQVLAHEDTADYAGLPSLAKRRTEELLLLLALAPGDQVVATSGLSTILALGTVVAPGYIWRPDRNAAKHTITVQWDTSIAKRIQRQETWAGVTIRQVPAELRTIMLEQLGFETPPRTDLAAICAHFGTSLLASGIRFGPRHSDLVRSFIASLATKRLAILTGLSGSGKTQIGLRFGQWLGHERYKVVSVRPDWTGSEALFGYADALIPLVHGRSTWHVPAALEFMLAAHHDPNHPYLLVLDEMNLAHVERYFADFLSGMESGERCLPNLRKESDSNWRLVPDADKELPIPENLFVVGTVNVDETTYMFSPKVLDRANTFEFRVRTEDLADAVRKPLPCEPGDSDLVRGFLEIAADDEWQQHRPAPELDQYLRWLQDLHRLLADGGFEFGHRVYYEAIRYAAMLAACGDDTPENALDQQVMQKVLPRLHGTRKRLEGTLCSLGKFCFDLTYPDTTSATARFDPEQPPQGQQPKLPLSFDKVQRMTRTLRTNQFTSFTE